MSNLNLTGGLFVKKLVLCVSLFLGIAGMTIAQDQTAPAEPAKETAVQTEELKIGTTVENLQAALTGELSAKERYLAFSAKADEEGYLQVGRLFRATARSEEVHAGRLAKAIEKMGGTPVMDAQKPEVATTRENLEAAVKGESYENTTMYPAFIKKAEEEKAEAALYPFKGAMAAEEGHARFYSEALKDLEATKQLGVEYLVCLTCGYTTDDAAIQKCPVCEAPREKFETVK